MTLDIKVSAALMKYNFLEQNKIFHALETDTVEKLTKYLREGAEAAIEVMDSWEPVIEGYGGFPIEKEAVAKKKMEFKRDKNVGRVVSSGGDQMLVTGRKADGRYVVMGKDGRKTAKDAVDIGVTAKESVVGVDLDDLHESMKQARKNVGASTCWKGYKAKGTKKKDGKVVPNCVKEEDKIEEGKKGLWDNIHAKRKRGEKPAKPGDKDYPKTLDVESFKLEIKPKYDWRSNMKEAVYGGKPKMPDKPMLVTNADKKANTPAYQKMKAGDKRYKAADHMKEGDS